ASMSTTKAQTLIGRVTANGILLPLQAELVVPPDLPSPSQSTLEGESPVAPGESSALVLTLRDEYGNPTPSQPITVEADGGTVLMNSGSTDANGQLAGTFSSPIPGTFTISAKFFEGIMAVGQVTVTP